MSLTSHLYRILREPEQQKLGWVHTVDFSSADSALKDGTRVLFKLSLQIFSSADSALKDGTRVLFKLSLQIVNGDRKGWVHIVAFSSADSSLKEEQVLFKLSLPIVNGDRKGWVHIVAFSSADSSLKDGTSTF